MNIVIHKIIENFLSLFSCLPKIGFLLVQDGSKTNISDGWQAQKEV
jgi:hypothetical protein